MDKQCWVVNDVAEDTTTITADKDKGTVEIVSNEFGNSGAVCMVYDLGQLDTLIAALTEARRAIS